MNHKLDIDTVPAEHLTAWWARLLDSSLITPKSAPSSESFWRWTILALLSIPVSAFYLIQLSQGDIFFMAIAVPAFFVTSPFNAWITYLQIKLPHQGLEDVSWFNMPSLTRRAGSREQRWLRQWRLATMGKLLAQVAVLVFIAVVLARYVVH
jgi:hypothetical protein